MSVLREQPRENDFRKSFEPKYKSTIAVDKYYLIYKKSKNKKAPSAVADVITFLLTREVKTSDIQNNFIVLPKLFCF